MIQGQNLTLQVYQVVEMDDDYVGGAVPTGTYIGNVYARLDQAPGADLLLLQGIEAGETYQAEITNINVWVPISFNDQVQVVEPTNHNLFGHRLRVRHIRESSMLRDDPRHFRSALLSRAIASHRNMP